MIFISMNGKVEHYFPCWLWMFGQMSSVVSWLVSGLWWYLVKCHPECGILDTSVSEVIVLFLNYSHLITCSNISSCIVVVISNRPVISDHIIDIGNIYPHIHIHTSTKISISAFSSSTIGPTTSSTISAPSPATTSIIFTSSTSRRRTARAYYVK